MATKPNYLLQSISLNNFMLHQKTHLTLGEHPIFLVTGANGSGKTQILDALILALGHHPRRLKKGTFENLIGSFGEQAEITLELAILPETRKELSILPQEASDLVKNIDTNQWKISVILHPKTGLTYYVEGDDQRFKVKRRTIRDIFYALSIKGENKLAFTEEGTVNVFADHSSKNKLELFLETTGLSDYRANLVASMQSIEKATRAVEPLRRKLILEQEYLQSMEKTRQLMEQKAAMIEEHSQLVTEEAWIEVQNLEKECDLMKSRLDKKQKEAEDLRKDCRQLQEKKQELDSVTDDYNSQGKVLKKNLEKQRSRLNTLEGQNNSNLRNLHSIKEKLEDLHKRLEKVTADQESGERLKQLHKRLKKIQTELDKIERIMEATGQDFFDLQLETERKTLGEVLHFSKATQGLKEFYGPLFHEIKLNPKAPQNAWEILGKLLGEHIFDFITPEQKTFNAAHAALKKLWPDEHRPAFYIVQCPASVKKPAPTKNSILKWITAPAPVLQFIEGILELRVLSEKEDPWSCKKGRSWSKGEIYLPWPAVGSGWSSRILPCLLNLSFTELAEAIHAQETYQSLKKEQQEIMEHCRALDTEKQVQYLQERIEELNNDAKKSQKEIDDTTAAQQQQKAEFQETQAKFQDIEELLDKKQEQLAEIKQDLSRAELDLENVETILENLEPTYETKSEKLQDSITTAEEKGLRPEKIRSLPTVTKRKIYLEAKLDAIHIAPISEDLYNAQKEKVDKLEQEMAGTKMHLERLREDMERRFEDWYLEVAEKIKDITNFMNYLLSSFTGGVRLRIENIKDPENSGLHIEIKRHGKRWLDLSHLSGGEKVLTVEALILALHLQTYSPLHAIDECTQRLDLKSKALAFEMAQKAVEEATKIKQGSYEPQFLLLAPDTIGVTFRKVLKSISKE